MSGPGPAQSIYNFKTGAYTPTSQVTVDSVVLVAGSRTYVFSHVSIIAIKCHYLTHGFVWPIYFGPGLSYEVNF